MEKKNLLSKQTAQILPAGLLRVLFSATCRGTNTDRLYTVVAKDTSFFKMYVRTLIHSENAHFWTQELNGTLFVLCEAVMTPQAGFILKRYLPRKSLGFTSHHVESVFSVFTLNLALKLCRVPPCSTVSYVCTMMAECHPDCL